MINLYAQPLSKHEIGKETQVLEEHFRESPQNGLICKNTREFEKTTLSFCSELLLKTLGQIMEKFSQERLSPRFIHGSGAISLYPEKKSSNLFLKHHFQSL